MMKNSKEHKTALPELRFSEFGNNEKWESDSIGNVCLSYSGGTPTTTESRYYGGHIPFIRSAEINKNETELFLTTDGLHNSSAKEVNKGDVLIALYGANSGDVAISKIDGAINQAILCLKPEQSNEFLYQYLTFKKEDIISTFIQGGQGNLSGEIIKSLKLFFPKPNEQKKIAECFSSLDDLISAATDKIEALKEHKEGLMQQLFPADGKITPTIRFPEFHNAGEWRETTLGYLCNSIASGKNKNNIGGDYDLYGSTGIIGKTDSGDYCGTYILVARVGANAGFLTKVDGVFGVTDNTLVINLKSGISIDYIYYLLNNWGLNNLIFGSGQPLITGSQLKNLEITVPSPLEQQKIANCFSSIDKLISAETDKLDQLKAHKKGLMQRLFPKL